MRVRTALVVGILGTVAVCVPAVIVSAARLGSSLEKLDAEPSALAPIPVDPAACPSLTRVRDAAEAADESWRDLSTDDSQWHPCAAQLAPELQILADALRDAIPRTPTPIALPLQRALEEVEIGQRELPSAANIYEYLSRTSVLTGVRALTRASELIGPACGAPISRGSM